MNKQEYKQANIDWLKAKAQEEGVKALPKGIYYKVISEGKNDGVHPTPRSVVTAHYTGWTIDGKVFDSSRHIPYLRLQFSYYLHNYANLLKIPDRNDI